MNTIRSTWYGWATLCVAGGGAYYFAKKSINADRQSRFEAEMRRKDRFARAERSSVLEEAANMASTSADSNITASGRKKAIEKEHNVPQRREAAQDHAGSPSSEASEDVAAVGHAPVSGEQKVKEKSKYEAAEPYKSKKGDRFS